MMKIFLLMMLTCFSLFGQNSGCQWDGKSASFDCDTEANCKKVLVQGVAKASFSKGTCHLECNKCETCETTLEMKCVCPTATNTQARDNKSSEGGNGTKVIQASDKK